MLACFAQCEGSEMEKATSPARRTRWLCRGSVTIGALVLLLAATVLGGEAARHTAPFAAADGSPDPDAVAVMERVDLNGSRQEVWLRGADRRLPLLVLLHGGPGASESALFRHYVPQLERHFVVVYWDQRGTGRSWLPGARREALGLPQLLDDLDALVGHLTQRFGRRQVVLLGHSWGTVLGTLYAQRRPERVSHYIGVAQVVDLARAQALEREYVATQALARGDAAVLQELRDLGEPPLPVKAMLRLGALCECYGGVFHGPMRTHDLLLSALREDETALLDLALFGLGNRFSLERLWPEYTAIDFLRSVHALRVPVTLMLGRRDRHVSSELAAQWFAALQAPAKRLVWFERSARNPPFEEPEAFVREVLALDRRLTAPPASRNAPP
ncbi:MAG: alpha/beta fold hydrolase [Ramlibacter sp.]